MRIRSEHPFSMERLRVLVATEDRRELAMIRAALRTRGDVGAVLVASDGLEAYVIARKEAPDVAIVSAALPRVSGDVLAREFAWSPLCRGLRTLLIVEDRADPAHDEALAEASGVLARPFGPKELLDRLDLAVAVAAGSSC